MNVLLLTNHLKNYAGSEIQILELYRFFKEKGYGITIFSNLIDEPISNHFQESDLCNDIESLDIEKYQFIWSQHGVFPLLFSKRCNYKINAIILSVHLSPFENMELLQIPYMNYIGAHFIANSLETKDRLIAIGVPDDHIHVSYNCAPISFKKDYVFPSKSLTNLAIISNHPPSEIIDAFELLRKEICIDFIGEYENNQKLVTPELIDKYDCIISIGKTVQYSILANKPVYCYDYFGGPGYLNFENFEKAEYYNFSGRGFDRKSPELIAHDLITQFSANNQFPSLISNKGKYILENFMEKMLNLPPQTISKEQQFFIQQFIPTSKKIAQLFSQNQKYRDINLLKDKNLKIKRYKYKTIIYCMAIFIIFFFIWYLNFRM